MYFRNEDSLEKTNVFHNVLKVWPKCGKTVKVEFHNFFLFHDMEFKLDVEVVWKLCGISDIIIKHIE